MIDFAQSEVEQVKKSLVDEGFECFEVDIGGPGASLHAKSDLNVF